MGRQGINIVICARPKCDKPVVGRRIDNPVSLNINEREEHNRYEACAAINGWLISKVVLRDPITGWPYDYKVKAHDEIRAAYAATVTRKETKNGR